MRKKQPNPPAVDPRIIVKEFKAIRELNAVLSKYFPDAEDSESIARSLEYLLSMHCNQPPLVNSPQYKEMLAKVMKFADETIFNTKPHVPSSYAPGTVPPGVFPPGFLIPGTRPKNI